MKIILLWCFTLFLQNVAENICLNNTAARTALGCTVKIYVYHIKYVNPFSFLVVLYSRHLTANSQFQRWAPALFSCFRARKRAALKRAGAWRKRARKKIKSAESEGKKRKFALFPPFAASHWKPGSRAPKQLKSGKTKGFEPRWMLHTKTTFH